MEQRERLTVASGVMIRAENETGGAHQCTLELDMTFDDRRFFSHAMHGLQAMAGQDRSMIEFTTLNNKVRVQGDAPAVYEKLRCFFLRSTLTMHFEFEFENKQILDRYLMEQFGLDQQRYRSRKVFISMVPVAGRHVLFQLLTYRSNYLELIRTASDLRLRLAFRRIGRAMAEVHCCLQIPVLERGSRWVSHPEHVRKVQAETNTKIQVLSRTGYPADYPFINVIITGQRLCSVVAARFRLTSRFQYELRFSVGFPIQREWLADIALGLRYDHALFSLTILPEQPYTACPVVAIHATEQSAAEMFLLRHQLLNRVRNSIIRQ